MFGANTAASDEAGGDGAHQHAEEGFRQEGGIDRWRRPAVVHQCAEQGALEVDVECIEEHAGCDQGQDPLMECPQGQAVQPGTGVDRTSVSVGHEFPSSRFLPPALPAPAADARS
jgi:hypothetical protein